MRVWTEAEINTLKKGYHTLGARGLERKTGIPATSIRRKAAELGLRKNPQLTASTPFTPSMDRQLKSMYRSGWMHQEIADELELSTQQVYRRIRKLNLVRRGISRSGRRWTDEENEILRASYGRIDPEKLVKKLKRTFDAIDKQACKLGLVGKRLRWTDEEIQFLRDSHLKRSFEEVCEHLDRTPYAIVAKVKTLDLPFYFQFRTKPTGDLDDSIIPF